MTSRTVSVDRPVSESCWMKLGGELTAISPPLVLTATSAELLEVFKEQCLQLTHPSDTH